MGEAGAVMWRGRGPAAPMLPPVAAAPLMLLVPGAAALMLPPDAATATGISPALAFVVPDRNCAVKVIRGSEGLECHFTMCGDSSIHHPSAHHPDSIASRMQSSAHQRVAEVTPTGPRRGSQQPPSLRVLWLHRLDRRAIQRQIGRRDTPPCFRGGKLERRRNTVTERRIITKMA